MWLEVGMWFLFLFCHTVAGDMFDYHMSKFLDMNIQPCEDFYSHVCPYPMRASDIYKDQIGKPILAKVRPYIDVSMDTFLREIEMDIFNDQQENRNITETKRLIEQRCETDSKTKEALKSVVGVGYFVAYSCSQLSQSYIFAEKNEFEKPQEAYYKIRDLIEVHAFNTYREKDLADFEKYFHKAVVLFEKLRHHILLEAKKSPWLQRILPNATEILRTLKLVKPKKIEFAKEWATATEKYRECYSTLSGLTKNDARLCASFAIRELSVYLRFKGSPRSLTVFNAFYDEISNVVDIVPALFFSDLKENKQEIILSFIIAHEIAHSIYTNFRIQPNNADCLVANAEMSCDLFKKGYQCHSGEITYQEDVADWVAMQAALFLYQNQTQVFPNYTKRQSLFYILSIMWCANLKNQGADFHSLPIVRVNGNLRQLKEFQDEFKCFEKDKMVAEKRCFLLGENATKKKSIFSD